MERLLLLCGILELFIGVFSFYHKPKKRWSWSKRSWDKIDSSEFKEQLLRILIGTFGIIYGVVFIYHYFILL